MRSQFLDHLAAVMLWSIFGLSLVANVLALALAFASR